jgi:hypothetical protein
MSQTFIKNNLHVPPEHQMQMLAEFGCQGRVLVQSETKTEQRTKTNSRVILCGKKIKDLYSSLPETERILHKYIPQLIQRF